MMSTTAAPMTKNELQRLMELAEYDLDYMDIADTFHDLSELAAKVAGTEISLVTMLDSYNQWTVASHNLDLTHMDREDSVCQYTIMGDTAYEVTDLSEDERFKNKAYVVSGPMAKYYYGIPLRTSSGHNLGALCVLDKKQKHIDGEKAEMLKLIAREIVQRLDGMKAINVLKHKLQDANRAKMTVAHDIRGPLSGIVGISQILQDQADDNSVEDMLDYVKLIEHSGNSLIELANDILNHEKLARQRHSEGELTLGSFKEKLEKLYAPQALNKKINFSVTVKDSNAATTLGKDRLLQLTGNLISNALKFTPENGEVLVTMETMVTDSKSTLHIAVSDTGVGLDEAKIDSILHGDAASTNGTGGELGFGFGLAMVKGLVDKLGGKLTITARPMQGATFSVTLPQEGLLPAVDKANLTAMAETI